jgi:L-methionine (R)-S-oxide reductase
MQLSKSLLLQNRFNIMAENIVIPTGLSKEEGYQSLIPQIEALISGEKNLIANLANISAALHSAFNFHWVGFYLVDGEELVLGPFQGPVACTRIGYGKGVCGTAWKEKRTLIVDDVDLFPGHIACSALSRSEIVLPAFRDEKVFLVMDIDSNRVAAFDAVDEKYLNRIIQLIEAF